LDARKARKDDHLSQYTIQSTEKYNFSNLNINNGNNDNNINKNDLLTNSLAPHEVFVDSRISPLRSRNNTEDEVSKNAKVNTNSGLSLIDKLIQNKQNVMVSPDYALSNTSKTNNNT